MGEFKKSYAIALAVLAFSLTFMGVVLAATDPNPAGIPRDTLNLKGVPPHSASLLVTISNGQAYDVTATVNANFVTSRAEAIMSFPLLFTQTSVDLRLAGDHVFAEAADVSSGKWLETTAHLPSFFGLALELTDPGPDLKLIDGFHHESTTSNGTYTTYDFASDRVALTNVLHAPKKTVLGSLAITVTTGTGGEVTALTMIAHTRHDMSKVTVQVLSYNQPVSIAVPAPSDVSSLKVSSLGQLFASTSIATLLLPENFSSLLQGTSQVS